MLLQFVHMMVDSDPGSHGQQGYQGRRLSVDLAAAEDQQKPAEAPVPA